MQKVAVVAGATGVAGNSLTRYLVDQADWHVIPIARDLSSLSDLKGNLTPIVADLYDRSELKRKLEPHAVTHLFHTAWVNPPGGLRESESQLINPVRIHRQLDFAKRWVVPQLKRSRRLQTLFYRGFLRAAGCYDPEDRNLQMLANLTAVLEQPPHQLKHVALLTGGRFYGMHMGPAIWPDYQTPFTEDML